jgi:hypothetical protein
MKKQKRTPILLILVLAVSACTGRVNTNPQSDSLRNVAVQVARLSDAANAGARTVIALGQDGLITPAQEREALLIIQKANDGARVLTTRLRGIVALDANSKSSLLTVVNEISLALQDQKTLALFNVTNPKSKERLRGVLDVIATVIGLLKNLLGGA